MGVSRIRLAESREHGEPREGNLLANRGCKTQTAKTTTPLLPESAETYPLVNRTGNGNQGLAFLIFFYT
jgi:hypothetical protein